MTRALLLLAFLFALALGGCGGDGDDPSTTASSQATVAQAPKTRAPEPKPKPAEHTESAKRTTPHNAPGTPGDPTPGEKAPAPGVPVTPEGDNSVQTFGTEGEETERQQAEAGLHAYLDARAEGDWQGACEAASAQLTEELAKLTERAKAKPGTEKPKGCAGTLEALYGKAPPETLKQAAHIGEVLSFRIREDGYAYLIYEDPQGDVKFIAMANDDGAWKVNTPEPAQFEGSQGETQ